MHPAPTILVFTTASGAGYGLLFLLGSERHQTDPIDFLDAPEPAEDPQPTA